MVLITILERVAPINRFSSLELHMRSDEAGRKPERARAGRGMFAGAEHFIQVPVGVLRFAIGLPLPYYSPAAWARPCAASLVVASPLKRTGSLLQGDAERPAGPTCSHQGGVRLV